MSTLHIVNKTGQPLELCLRSLNQDDTVLLIEEGVYNLLESNEKLTGIDQKILVLGDDCKARGIKIDRNDINTISIDEFVVLTEQCSKIISWY